MEPVNPQALEQLKTLNYHMLPYLIFVPMIIGSMYYVFVKKCVIRLVFITLLPLFVSFDVNHILTDIYTYGYFTFDLGFFILQVFYIVFLLVAIAYARVGEVAGKGIYKLFDFIERQ